MQGSYNGWVIPSLALYEVAPYGPSPVLPSLCRIADEYGYLGRDVRPTESWVEEARDIYVQKSYDIGMGLFDQYYKTMEDAEQIFIRLRRRKKRLSGHVHIPVR